MIVEDYMLPNTAECRVIVQDSLPRLLFVDRDSGSPRASLLVWKRALINPALERFFSAADWTLRAIDSMPPSPDWNWTAGEGDELTSNPSEIHARLSAASGIGGRPPSGNVNVTLRVRSYEERKTSRGGLNWWLERLSAVSKNPFGETFMKALINVLQTSAGEGAPLFVEQVSIIISKDRNAPIATLTPTLHADSYYGPRETAICSLLETGWNSMGGAMYLPERRMDQLWHMRPITIDKLMNDMQDEVILKTGTGDILIYDGMIGADGLALTRNGIPHISPEIAGKSSRMSLLMHRRAHGDRLHE